MGSLYPGASGNRNLPVRHSRPFQCGKKIPYTLRYSSAFAGGVLGEEEETRKKLEEENILAAGQSSYLTNYAHYPVYVNTETEYYPLGDVWFEHFIEELKRQNTTFLWNISSSARGICGIRCWRF